MFNVEQIDFAESSKELNKKEVFHIMRLKTLAPRGYNLTTGGEGYNVSEETRKKQSETALNRTEEVNIKMHSWERTKEICEKISRTLTQAHCTHGHPFDEVNTYVSPVSGRRSCWTCHLLRHKRRIPEKFSKYVVMTK
jgi:hypothetical protein